MRTDEKKIPLEVKLEKAVDSFAHFFTHIPKDKEKRKYWMFDILAITLNILSIASIIVAMILRAR